MTVSKCTSPKPDVSLFSKAAASSVDSNRGLLRLNKRLADMGLCSRREADVWVERGWVRVNGEVAQLGQKVCTSDVVTVQKEASARQARRVTVLLHKPIGVVSTQPEEDKREALELIRLENQWALDRSGQRLRPDHLRGLAAAGRLDIDSTGLLVLTQDGRVARHLIGQDSLVEKEYLVRVCLPEQSLQRGGQAPDVQAAFSKNKLALLRHGLSLDGKALKPAQVEWQNPQQLRFVLQEGKKRQIRRMCELVGLHVLGLKRVRIGGVVLGNLPIGQWRFLPTQGTF